ncbi:MAG: hypothetical protein AAGG44_01280 [Planctomycetota bacterium]
MSASTVGCRETAAMLLVVAALIVPAFSCDYTVRDLGFVPFNDVSRTLVVRCNESHPVPEDLESWLAKRRIGLRLVHQQPDSAIVAWNIELVDSGGRKLQLASSDDWEQFPDLRQLLDELLDTPRLNELRQHALASFAQIVFLASDQDASRDIAVEASGAMQQLEPMLPRPVNLPIHVLDLAPEERSRERFLLWCLGLEAMSEDQTSMAVIYGRGRLAGPVLSGEQLKIENVLRQLALVGESCECDTSRDWTLFPEVPLFWSDENSRAAQLALGFDPASDETLADVKEVLSRGRRGTVVGKQSDRLDQIVAGYFEGSIDPHEPKLLAIPPGRKSKNDDQVVATVIQGEGWGFGDGSAASEPQSTVSEETVDTTDGSLPIQERTDGPSGVGRKERPGARIPAGSKHSRLPIRSRVIQATTVVFTVALAAFAMLMWRRKILRS